MLYWFCPNGHWNVVTKEAYEYLLQFYGDEEGWLTTTEDNKNPNEGGKK